MSETKYYCGIVQGPIFVEPVYAETEAQAREMMIQQIIAQIRDEKKSPLAVVESWKPYKIESLGP